MNLAPIHIHPLLEIHVMAYKENCHYVGSNTSMAIRDLMTTGLIEMDPRAPPDGAEELHGYTVTPKGEAYIKALLATPMPTQIWSVSYGQSQEE